MNKSEWREHLQQYVGQLAAIVEETRSSRVLGSGHPGTMGSRMSHTHYGIITLILIDAASLTTDDATLRLAPRMARFPFGDTMASEVNLALLMRTFNASDDYRMSQQIENTSARLPTSFLEDPKSINNEDFRRDTSPKPMDHRTVKLILGNTAVVNELRQWSYRLNPLIVAATLVELWRAADLPQPPPTEAVDPLKFLVSLRELMELRRYQIDRLEGLTPAGLREPSELAKYSLTQHDEPRRLTALRGMIDETLTLLIVHLHLGEHPLVIATKQQLASGREALPSITP